MDGASFTASGPGNISDLVSITKGQTQNIGQLAAWATSPGQTLSSTASPKATVIATLGSTSTLAVASSTTRRGIEFHSSDPSGNTNIWVMPQTTAVVKQGILLVPGARYQIGNALAANAGFSCIASSGSTNVLTIVEFF